MPTPLPILAPHPPRRSPSSPRAFTLIEILVVVGIIVILAAITIGIGSQVKAGAAIRSTHVTLKTLEGVMKDYLVAGNPEPTTATPPPYDNTTWVIALRANPEYAKKLSNLPTDSTHILDAFGMPITYIPYSTATKKEGYFESNGPDRSFGNADDLFSTDP